MPAVGPPSFTFALALSHEPRFDPMLTELTTAVLRHLGYPPGEVAELIGVIQGAMARCTANGGRDCQVAFRAHGGELHLAISFADGVEWRTSRLLP